MIINKFPGQDENSDKTFVTKDTTLEITTESGKKSTKKASELTDEERDIFNSRGYNALGGNRVYDDLTDETKKLRSAWSEAPTVKIENGKLKISGSSEFLKSNEAKQLRDVMKQMKGNYYNTEDLNKQIEAWNSVLAQMSDEYIKMINATNAANASISETAKGPQHHVFTLQDTQKIGNSARIGKQADARTTKNKIFVGYEWDDDGKMVEKWVEAKDFFNEINKIPNEEKRNYIRDLNTKAANGDVGAYSKLMYIQGGSEGMPTNIDYDQTDDFWKTFGENALVQLGEFADFVTTYVPIFNLPRVTSRAVNAFQKGDINAFFESDYARKMLDDYNEVVNWENAYFSQLTPGSTRLAAGTGNLTGYALGMAFSIWAGGVGNQAAAAVTSNAIANANNALRMTGKFTEFSRTTTGFGRPTLTNGALPSGLSETFAASSSARVLLPTALVQKFPNFARFLATSALNVMQYAGIGEGITGTIKDPNLVERGLKIGPQVNIHSGFGGTMADVFGTGDRVVTVTENSMVMPNAPQAANSIGTNLLPQGLKVEQFNDGIAVSGRTIKAFSETSTALNKTISSGLQTALRLVPLAGESALRNTDRYLQGVNAGKDMGDMGEYIATNTAHDIIVGGAFIGAGAMIRKLRGVSAAARVSPSRVTEEAFNVTNQSEWFSNGHFTYDKGESYLAPASLANDVELQDFVARVMTVNGESLFVSPNRTPVATGYEGITTDFTVDSSGGVAPSGVTTVHPTTIEFAPIPDTAARDTGQAFGFASSNRITKLTVEPENGGGYLVKTEYNVDTGTTTETRKFYTNIDEAVAEVKKQSVPKTSPKTIENSDQVKDAKVAPLTIDGEAPDVMPDGVSQVRVQPGIVYRTPDEAVEEISEIFKLAGGDTDAIAGYYSDYIEYFSSGIGAEAPAPESPWLLGGASDWTESGGRNVLPAEIIELVKAAAWAKAKGCDLVPLRAPVSRVRRYKKFSMQDKFISKLADKYEFPEININDTVDGEKTHNRQGRSNAIGSGILNLAANQENPTRAIFPSANYGTSFVGKKPVLASVLPKNVYDIVKAFGWFKVLNGVVGNDPTKNLRSEIDEVNNDVIDAYIEAVGLEEFSSKMALEDIIYRVKSLIQTLGADEPKEKLVKYVADFWNRNLDGRLNMIDSDTWAVSEWKESSKKLVDKYRPRVEEAAKLFVDVALENIDMNARGVNEDIRNISNIADDAIYDASLKLLKENLDSANSKLSSGIKIKAIESSVPGIYVTGSLIPHVMEGKEKILHIPEGTKYIVPVNKFINAYSDGESFAFDGSNGVTEKDGELYLNLPSGAEYTPTAAQYELSKFAIYDQDDVSGYMKLRDWLKPVRGIKKAQGEKEKYWEPSVFNMVAPSGAVNQNNKVLRENGGKIPKDTLASRGEAAKKELEYLRNLYDGESTHELGQILNAHKRAKDVLTGKVISNRTTEDTRLSQMRSYYDNFGAGGDNLTDEEKKIASEMFADIEDTLEATEDRLINETEYNRKVIGTDHIIDEYEKVIDGLVKKWGKKLGTSKNDMSPWFRLIDTWGRKGSHTLNLPEGVDYIWTFRGNPGSEATTDKTRMSAWEPGDHINAPSLDFNSLNTFTPYRYSEEYNQDEFVLAIGHPNGTGIFYFGDPENFGDRVHRADGGAIVTPYNMGMTVVAIRTIGKNDAGKDIKLIIAIRDNADGTPYDGPIEGQGGGVEKAGRIQVREEDEVIEEFNKFLVTQYGAPEKWFPTKEEALKYAEDMGERAVYEIDDSSDALERPPVTMDVFKALEAGQPVLKLTAGGHPTEALQRFNDLMVALTTLESPEDYTRGIIDIVHQVQAIYNQVALNVNLDLVYESYGKAIAEGKEPEALSVEMEALRPLLQVLDALGHYFDPSGKSLTQKFYLPTMLKPNKKVNIEDAILGKDDVVDPESPVDGGLDDILLDPTRVGDSGFWQQRSGDLFRDADGNFTMDKAAPLEDAVIAYTVSALTRGKNKLYVAAQNEVARSKFDRNRAQITSKQAMAGLKDADTLRTKAKAIQANIVKDAEALAEIKENYSGEESTIDKALEEKNYAAELNYTTSVNTMAQKLGFNQFMQMNNIPGSALRFGANATGFRGIANIRRKLEKINVTGTMWVNRYGEKVNIGFGLEPTPANKQAYGDFKPEKAVNLGQVVGLHFDADRAAKAFLDVMLNNALDKWSGGDGWDLMSAISNFAIENFPLVTNYELYTADLMKKLAQNYNKYKDPKEVYLANVAEISAWIRRGTLTTFNNAIKMSNISNLDERTIRALDEAAATMLIGSPVQRAKTINAAQELAVWAALGGNVRVTPGNALQEPLRLIDVVGYRGFAKAWKTALNPKEAARINNLLDDLPSRFSETEMVGLANKAKSTFGKLKEKASHVVLSPLEKSEQFKNILFWAAAEDNAKAKYPGDPIKQLQETLRFFNDYAIAGGRGTAPGITTSSAGRLINIFKTFSIRNFDDFIDYVEKVSRGESGNNYWDKKYEKRHGGGSGDGADGSDAGKKAYKDRSGRNKFDPRIAIRVVGGRVLRSYLFWLLVGSYLGKSFFDSLGGDPSGITEGGFDRGLYDDPDTKEYEGMTGFDDFVNSLPAGFILGALQDLYFAARRRGIEQHQFFGFDIGNDERFTKSLQSKLPLGVAKNRFSDMLDLVDRGYSFSSTGRKTYAAPESALDTLKGFLFGKATTQNSLAYGKYRYGMIDIWGDLSSGDWMDFAMNANPFSDNAKFDTTRKDYTGVFNGSWNDISTMQLIIQQFRERNKQIIADFQENKYRYRGDYEGLSDEEKEAKAKEQREKDIAAFTDDVTRAVDAFEKAGNTLNDNQITNIMYLFDFHEGEEDDEWNSSYARKRYVEAGLPDYNAGAITRGTKTVDGEKQDVTKNILDRSLLLQNAQQGYYGSSKEAANAVKNALRDFKPTYQQYNKRVKELNNKYFAARNRSKNSAETKQLSKELESLQNEYLDKLFDKLAPVMSEYGTALVGTYDVADVLEDYMGNMIPYSSIRKYGQTYSSGNDIVYGQLTEWLQKRLGRNAPTAASDKEVTNGITEIKKLLDQGKTSAARSKARAILEKIGRGSLGARNYDVETLRGYAYD